MRQCEYTSLKRQCYARENRQIKPNPFCLQTHERPFLKPVVRLPHQVVQVSLEALTLDLECADRFQEDLVTVDLTSAFNTEDEVVADTAELHLVFELVVTEALSRNGVLHWVCNNSLLFTCGGVVFQCDDTTGEAAGELLCVCTENGLLDVD